MSDKHHNDDRGLANTILWTVLGGLVILFLLGACAADAIRLGAGECVVLPERQQIIVAGKDCNIRKVYR